MGGPNPSLKVRLICDKNSPVSTVLHECGSTRSVFFVILLIAAWVNVAFADVSVSVSDNLEVGGNATFSCFPDGTLRRLTWSKTSSEVTSPNPEYIVQYLVGFSASFGTGVDTTHYKFDEATNEMNILGITLDDGGRYWCEASVVETADASNSTLASIIDPVGAATTSITYNGETYMDGKKVKVDAGVQTFTCITTGVKPAATFQWTPNPLSETLSCKPNEGDNRLSDCTSEVTIEIMRPLSPTQIVCAASNTDADVKITMNLELNAITTTVGPPSTPKPTGTTGLSVVIIIVIVLGCLALLVILLVVCVAAWKCHKKAHVSPETYQNKNGKNIKANGKAAGTADV